MARTKWQIGLDGLRRDNRTGAAEMGQRAQELLVKEIGDSVPEDLEAYKQWLLRLSRDLLSAQPTLSVLFRLVNDMLWACGEARDPEQMRSQALDFLAERQDRMLRARGALTTHAAQYLQQYERLMTYSRSSSVLESLLALYKRNERVHVRCGEARPAFEGQTLAQELGWAGMNVTVGIDMALFGWLSEVDALVLGADSLSANGLVNKIGSAALVRAAEEAGVPRIVLCTTLKFMPEDYMLDQSLREADPEEIMPVSSKNVQVSNIYHDITPFDALTAVVTEHGAQEYSSLHRELEAVRTYPGIRKQ